VPGVTARQNVAVELSRFSIASDYRRLCGSLVRISGLMWMYNFRICKIVHVRLTEHGLTSAPTQHRLYGRRVVRVSLSFDVLLIEIPKICHNLLTTKKEGSKIIVMHSVHIYTGQLARVLPVL